MGKKTAKKSKKSVKLDKSEKQTEKIEKIEETKKTIPKENSILKKALIIITIVLAVLIVVRLSGKDQKNTLEENNAKIITALQSSGTGLSVIRGNIIDAQKISRLDYDQLKKEYNIESDFAIYFEDENQDIVSIAGHTCFGSPEIRVNGVPCKNK